VHQEGSNVVPATVTDELFQDSASDAEREYAVQQIRAGEPVSAFCALDAREHGRRVSAGMAAVTDLAVLDALLALPLGMPVSASSLSARLRALLRKAPVGAVRYEQTDVVRLAYAPLQVRRVEVTVLRSWRTALRRASQFSQYTQRVLVLDSVPRDVDDLTLQASFYGVGVVLGEQPEREQLVASQPFVVRRHSPARWAFAEECYGLLLRQMPVTHVNACN
jgi:hypothetical protein